MPTGIWRDMGARVRRAWFGVGLVATAQAVLWRLFRLDPERHRKPGEAPGPNPFDIEHGVDTGGFLSWRDLRSGEASDVYISGYFGTMPSIGRRLIGCVEQPERYTFVDVGCGKGRVLILASERPFARIVGVEIAGTLVESARANAATIADRFPDRRPIEVVHVDAGRFEGPPGPLVLFLYQPFERPVMRALLDRVAAWLAASARPIVIIYLNPTLAAVIDRVAAFERREEGTLAPTADERSYSYGGKGGTDKFLIWATRTPRPGLTPVI